MKRKNEKGSIVAYALIALFLIGLLIAAMTQGSKKSAGTLQVDQMTLYLMSDIKTIQEVVNECAQVYPGKYDPDGDGVDNNANPNPPFPLYNDLSFGGMGDDVTAIKCPSMPAPSLVFTGNNANKFKMLGDTATYTTKYFTDATEGVYLRITRAAGEALWTETISRINSKSSTCAAAVVTAGGTCVNGCLYYWILRHSPGGGLGPEMGCP